MSDEVVVMSAHDVKRINSLSNGRKVPEEVISELDDSGFNVVGWTMLIDDGEAMRLLILLKMKNTLTPQEAIVDCPLVDYLDLKRVKVDFSGGDIDFV